jgi:hypothetical protein
MNSFKVNEPTIDTNGTSLQGYVFTTYSYLRDILGEPNQDNCDKVTCYWDIEFSDRSVATIYDWKTNSTPLGSYHWHIGGKAPRSVEQVSKLLNLTTER